MVTADHHLQQLIEQETCPEEQRRTLAMIGAKTGIWDWDLYTHDLYLSPELRYLLGYSADELPADVDRWHALFHPDDLPLWLETLHRYLESDSSAFEFEGRMHHHDGEYRSLLVRVTILRDADGMALRVLGVATDISQRKLSGLCLDKQHKLLHGVAHAVSALITAPEIEDALQQTARILGQATEVERVYVQEDVSVPGTPRCHIRCVWASEVLSGKVEDPEGRHEKHRLPLSWYERLHGGQAVAGNLEDFDGLEQAWLQTQGIRSFLLVPIHFKGRFWGCLGFDDCHSPHTWLPQEIDLLKVPADNIPAAIARYQAHTDLELSRNRLDALIEAMPVILLAINTKGLIDFAHGQGLQLLELRPEQLLDQCIFDVFPEAVQLQTDLARVLEGKGFSSVVQIGEHWFEAKYSPLRNMPPEFSAQIKFFEEEEECLAVLVDITPRLRAEQALQEEVQRNQMILETSMDGFCVIGMEGLLLEVNPALCNILGYDAADLLYTNLARLEVREGGESIATHIAITLQEGAHRFECKLCHRDGAAVHLQISANFVTFSEVQGDGLFFAFVRDVGDFKQTEADLRQAKEAAEAANRAKSDFLAAMSHEIRTPMNGLLGIADLLQYTPLNQQQQHYLGIMRNSGESLLRVINDILDYSKIEAGKLELESIDFDLRTLVEEVVNLFASQAHAKKLELLFHVPPTLPVELRGDPARLRQVFSNLLGNALKFTEEGEVMLLCAPAPVLNEQPDDERVHLHFEVVDTGIGISKNAEARLFQPFFQVDSSMARRYGGTGLGLIISRRLIHMMDGEIGVDSKVSQGSTFWFNIPFQRAHSKVAKALPAGVEALAGTSLLVVDDNTTCRDILRNQAMAWGMRVELARDRLEAWTLLNKARTLEQPFDAVLIDYELQRESGLELLYEIRETSGFEKIDTMLAVPLGLPAPVGNCERLMCISKPVLPASLIDCLLRLKRNEPPVVPQWSPPRQTSVPLPSSSETGDTEQGWRILLVEDNTVNQAVVQGMLARLDCQVTTRQNGLEALDVLRRSVFDLIFMDCHMPEMDGFEASIEIRKRNIFARNGRRIPVIALTANAMQGDRERCLEVGMDDYLAKPIKVEQLEEKISHWLELGNKPARAEAKTEAKAAEQRSPSLPASVAESKAAEEISAEIVNPKVLKRLSKEQGGEIGWLIDLFLGELPGYIEAIRQAFERQDSKALYLAAHKCKGSSANFGAMRLIALCKEIETLGKADKLEDASELVAKLDPESKRLADALEKYKHA